MPEVPSHHEGEKRQPLLIETEAGVTIEHMPINMLVDAAIQLRDRMALEMQRGLVGADDKELFPRILESSEATRKELLRRFSAMQERIASLEAEVATLKDSK